MLWNQELMMFLNQTCLNLSSEFGFGAEFHTAISAKVPRIQFLSSNFGELLNQFS